MEFLASLVDNELIAEDAISVAEAERDPPTHGIFGQNRRR